MKKSIVYCDESGNTGPNYIDPQQPFYVLAGWWVEENKESYSIDAVNSVLHAYTESASEIKGAALVKNSNGQKAILSLIRNLGKTGCVPIYVLAEKKYCVAAKIVETLLDPVYNQLVSYDFWNNVGFKQDTADVIYGLPDVVLTEFALAYHSLDPHALLKSINSISKSLLSISYSNLSILLSGSTKKISEIVDAEINSEEGIPGHGFRTLNMPVFADFICRVEQISRLAKVDEVSVLHDNIPEFKETYDWLFELYKNARRIDIPLSNGTIIPLGFQYLKNFALADSTSSTLIQAADVLASTIFYFASSIYRDKSIKPDLINIVQILLPATITVPQFGGLIASRNMIHKLGEYIRG